jgi:hypothetical protein
MTVFGQTASVRYLGNRYQLVFPEIKYQSKLPQPQPVSEQQSPLRGRRIDNDIYINYFFQSWGVPECALRAKYEE